MLFCSFCGKMQSEVRKLVAGPTAYICDECIELCRCIVEEEEKTVEKSPKNVLPEPKEIKKFLDHYVIGQEKTKKILSVPFIIIIKDCFPMSVLPTVLKFKKAMCF